jgi:hypothetical protein
MSCGTIIRGNPTVCEDYVDSSSRLRNTYFAGTLSERDAAELFGDVQESWGDLLGLSADELKSRKRFLELVADGKKWLVGKMSVAVYKSAKAKVDPAQLKLLKQLDGASRGKPATCCFSLFQGETTCVAFESNKSQGRRGGDPVDHFEREALDDRFPVDQPIRAAHPSAGPFLVVQSTEPCYYDEEHGCALMYAGLAVRLQRNVIVLWQQMWNYGQAGLPPDVAGYNNRNCLVFCYTRNGDEEKVEIKSARVEFNHRNAKNNKNATNTTKKSNIKKSNNTNKSK